MTSEEIDDIVDLIANEVNKHNNNKSQCNLKRISIRALLKTHETLTVKVGNKIVGAVIYERFVPGIYRDTLVHFIYHMVVNPKYRNKIYSFTLWSKLLDKLKCQDIFLISNNTGSFSSFVEYINSPSVEGYNHINKLYRVKRNVIDRSIKLAEKRHGKHYKDHRGCTNN